MALKKQINTSVNFADANSFIKHFKSKENWITYPNGNYYVALNLDNGTKIRITDDEEFSPLRPESIDFKISNQCNRGCAFCHEQSIPNGATADFEFVKTIIKNFPAYMEVAVGGGNILDNIEHTQHVLELLKDKKCIASITVHQKDFVEHVELIKKWEQQKLIYGIGVSITDITDEQLINYIKYFDNAVAHVIVGVFDKDYHNYLKGQCNKILFLGYKEIGRGINYYQSNTELINHNIQWLSNNLKSVCSSYRVSSFDNLALEQLPIKSMVSDNDWNKTYMGDDGMYTFYIDAVKKQYAVSSSSDKRYPIYDDDDNFIGMQKMFEFVQLVKDKE